MAPRPALANCHSHNNKIRVKEPFARAQRSNCNGKVVKPSVSNYHVCGEIGFDSRRSLFIDHF